MAIPEIAVRYDFRDWTLRTKNPAGSLFLVSFSALIYFIFRLITKPSCRNIFF